MGAGRAAAAGGEPVPGGVAGGLRRAAGAPGRARRARQGLQPRVGAGLRGRGGPAGGQPGAAERGAGPRPGPGRGGAGQPALGGAVVGLFTLVPHLGLRRLDGTPAVVAAGGGAAVSTGRLVAGSMGQLVRTLRSAPAFPQTLMFLVAYLFFNDGVQTVIAAASIYGQQQLGFAAGQLVTAILLVQVVALLGALGAGWVAQRTSAKATVLGSLVVWVGVVVAGMVIPAGAFGLFLALAAGIGLVLGGTQALSRSMFSQLVPRGREAEWFGLYQSAERGTSWLGTLVFGLVFQLTGSYRPAIASLVVFFVVGGVLLWRVDVARGRREAEQAPELSS
ncbi:MFS transporter [Quadrisphaera sp. INWT6]|nr:MFS transporter [Quadrisphaera sp. INWT6]